MKTLNRNTELGNIAVKVYFMCAVQSMKNTDKYRTIRSVSSGFYREKGSRFISVACPLNNSDEIKPLIDSVKKEHHEARHNCYAWVTGNSGENWRAYDDGEPSGTAGRPILGQIRSFGLTNVLIIVSRYFGGTLLGTGGLINAYRTAARSALENAEITVHVLSDRYELVFPYQSMNDVMRIIKEEDLKQSEHFFGMECRMTVSVNISATERVLSRFMRVEDLKYRYIDTD